MSAASSVLLLTSCLTAAAAQDLVCNVTQSEGGVNYTIQGLPESSDCLHSYSNSTQNVIAYRNSERDECFPELVEEHSASHLVTSQCLDQVHYEGSCGPGWEKYTTTCKAVCAEDWLVTPKATSDHKEVTVPVVAAVAAVVAAVGFALFVALKPSLRNRLRTWIDKLRGCTPAEN